MESIAQLQKYGHDPVTGGLCPPSQRTQINYAPVELGQDEILRCTSQSIEEIADLWQPGDADCGMQPSPLNGRILPRIDHVPWSYPLTDVTGRRLMVRDADIEAARRNWYAEQLRSAPRLTAVHHILGQSSPAWRGRMTGHDQEAREEWLASLWQPEKLRLLMESYRGIYRIDWSRLPENKILTPLATQHSRAERGGLATEKGLRLKLQRAKADLAAIVEIAVAVEQDDMTSAKQAHTKLADNAITYTAAAAKLRGIGVGIGSFHGATKAGKR